MSMSNVSKVQKEKDKQERKCKCDRGITWVVSGEGEAEKYICEICDGKGWLTVEEYNRCLESGVL